MSNAKNKSARTLHLSLLLSLFLHGFSFMLAGLILVFKDPSVLTELIGTGVFTVSPINYPIQVLPMAARFAAFLMPSTMAIIVVRELAITGLFEPVAFLQSVIFMLGLVLFFWAIGVGAFKRAERWTKNKGSIGGF